MDVGTDTVEGLRRHGEPGTPHAWNRYAFRHAVVLVDKLDGEISRIVDSKRTLPAGDASAVSAAALDAYINSSFAMSRTLREQKDMDEYSTVGDRRSPCSADDYAAGRSARRPERSSAASS